MKAGLQEFRRLLQGLMAVAARLAVDGLAGH